MPWQRKKSKTLQNILQKTVNDEELVDNEVLAADHEEKLADANSLPLTTMQLEPTHLLEAINNLSKVWTLC